MPIEIKELTGIPDAVRFNIESSNVGDTFAISVKVPNFSVLSAAVATDIPTSFRVLYVTDGDQNFIRASSVVDGTGRFLDADKPIEPIIIVSIGYGRGPLVHGLNRSRDFTPAGSPMGPGVVGVAKDIWGGAGEFLLGL